MNEIKVRSMWRIKKKNGGRNKERNEEIERKRRN
jgi:hypothetical protein